MSRIGKKIIPLPKGIEVKVEDKVVHVKGAKGSLQFPLYDGVALNIHPDHIEMSADQDVKDIAQYHGLYRALVSNMVTGVSTGFERRLEMIGVGYRAIVQGPDLNVSVGFSHPTLLNIPQGIQVVVEKNTTIVITGIDKQKVGQFAATVRSVRPPEPYKGKGIRYKGEHVRKKAGKAAASKK